ncbi:endonuclease/exonuclease/phosphatase family protein [Enterococcus asini]|uniref:endonuclease/exonuclease/phosphatase family protein n=1 Tax=Enterococcus asini TaxID=57732 RepID=UPI00288F4BE6|nr:endonuclease/exonuclease/phosphatase family protein [Enterococcus asini]MDT2755851.1 endonuclease/exonuclease/phosphatase family protein [Enterococcus asini]
MKILTLNTRSWVDGNKEQLPILAAEIAKEDYDVIALQEVNQSKDATEAYLDGFYCPTLTDAAIKADNFALKLVEALQVKDKEYYWSWSFCHYGYEPFEEGVALLSKEPMIAKDYVVTETEDYKADHGRRILVGLTAGDGQLIQVVSGHFDWWQEHFASEWQKTLVDVGTEHALIVAGDFNEPAQGPGYQLILASSDLQDAFTAAKERYGEFTVPGEIAGWEGDKEAKRVDYVFADANFEVLSYEVTFDGKKAPQISDHYGVSAVIRFKE